MDPKRITGRSSHPVFEALAASDRREILGFLLDRNTAVTGDELRSHLATTGQGPPLAASEVESQNIDVTHTHLPMLQDSGLISVDRDDATVTTATHPAFDDPRFRLLLDAEADGLDEALTNLANEPRRLLLTTLRDAQTSITERDLARELLRSDETDIEPSSNASDDVSASLYHVHLPALDDAGFIEYDIETGRATYTGHPAIEEVFTIIYQPVERLVDSYDDFFEGLGTAYDDLQRGTRTQAEWPHSWRGPSHG